MKSLEDLSRVRRNSIKRGENHQNSDLLYHAMIWRSKIEANLAILCHNDEIMPQWRKQIHLATMRSIMPRQCDFLCVFFTTNRGQGLNTLKLREQNIARTTTRVKENKFPPLETLFKRLT
jgi:hypothetical protein